MRSDSHVFVIACSMQDSFRVISQLFGARPFSGGFVWSVSFVLCVFFMRFVRYMRTIPASIPGNDFVYILACFDIFWLMIYVICVNIFAENSFFDGRYGPQQNTLTYINVG